MSNSLPDECMAIADVLHQWPETARVIVRRRMACLGCAFAPFMTLTEVAQSYRIDVNELRSELAQAIRVANETVET